ncbi:Gfo/Idh/MocA family oxidoreductase [bacterium]|nr:Gfo/Idh/MocA family oxidoreductase [bacterium]
MQHDLLSPFSRRDLLAGLAGTALLAGQVPKTLAMDFAPYQQKTDRVVRMGVIGGNFGASFYWHEHPNCRVTAVCDLRQDRIQRLQRVYNSQATPYTDYREMLRDRNVDAVGVFTPAPLHVEMSVAAMKAGKHVISAVPAALDLAGCRKLIDTAKSTGMVYMMSETSHFMCEIIAARKFARAGAFGTLFYTESEYHHEGLVNLWFEDAQGNLCLRENATRPTWRHGLPPMLYPTHCTGMIVPVTGERLVEVSCLGWGDDNPDLVGNAYKNPFWNETAFFRTEKGHAARVSVCWHLAAGGGERGSFYGDKMSLVMWRPEGSANKLGYPQRDPRLGEQENLKDYGHFSVYNVPNFWEMLPETMRHDSGHGGSHTFITHEFIQAILEGRPPEVDVYEAVAYTAPGIVAHKSALKGGETMKIPDFGRAQA